MKRIIVIAEIILLGIAGCGGEKQTTDDLITVDVTKSYPNRELILQDFMDVEYIVLEDTDEFITQGSVMAIGKEFIVTKNFVNDGDILIFDRNGKGIRKINHFGQGPGEYTFIHRIVLDEDNGEIIVHDYSPGKILVYNLNGTFIRSFKYNNEDEALHYSEVLNYDRNHLICYDNTGNTVEERQFYHVVISKQDGSIIQKIQLPFKEKKTTLIIHQEGEVTMVADAATHAMLPFQDQWILTQPSSDTIYRLLPDYRMIPFIVRTPSIQSMNPEVFLSLELFTDRYCFMRAMKKEGKFTNTGYVTIPQTSLMYDRQENALFEYSVFNGDFSNRKHVGIGAPVSSEISFWQRLEAYELVEAYKKGELKGKLKEIAAGLDSESNPVIMLVKDKK